MNGCVKLLGLALLTLPMAGCETMTRIFGTDHSQDRAIIAQSDLVIDEVCRTFPAITYSRSDTQETIRQVQDHNSARDALCK